MDASARDGRRAADAASSTVDRLRQDEAALAEGVAAARREAAACLEVARREAEAIAATGRVEAERVAVALRASAGAALDREREAARESLEREVAALEARAAARTPAAVAWLVALVRGEGA